MKVAARVGFLLLTAAVLQRAVFAQLRVGGVAVDVLLLLAVAGGLVAGADRGAVVGFFAGLTLDLLAQGPLGLSALTFCLVAFAVGTMRPSTRRTGRVVTMAIVGGASAAGVVLYAVLAEVIGQSAALSARLPVVVAVVFVANGLLGPIAVRAMRWALGEESTVRPALR